jgi:cyclic pyranopterin phosphate synthase
MVDVSAKSPTVRSAVASARLTMRPEVLRAILGRGLAKGDVLAAARLAGIMAAKNTSDWIPLCHPLPIDWVGIEFEAQGDRVLAITAAAKTRSATGVEMEALVAASAAALTVYDMAKAADKAIVIGPIQLERKAGGRSGVYRRPAERPDPPVKRASGKAPAGPRRDPGARRAK